MHGHGSLTHRLRPFIGYKSGKVRTGSLRRGHMCPGNVHPDCTPGIKFMPHTEQACGSNCLTKAAILEQAAAKA